MLEETWSENWRDTLLLDGTAPPKSFCLKKTTELELMCGQSAAFLLSCSVWWKRMPRLLWTANLYSQAKVVSLFRLLRTLLSSDRAFLSVARISSLLFLQWLERRVRQTKRLWLIRKLLNIWKPSSINLKSTWHWSIQGQAPKQSTSSTVSWYSIPTTESR